MTKRRSVKQRERHSKAAAAAPPAGTRREKGQADVHRKPGLFSQAAIRETVESVVIAFVLAFLFRTFEAEAFVIPTGSMAPTLMGRHKDVECPACGHWYPISASEEIDQETGRPSGHHVRAGTCPMCRYTADVGPGNPQRKTYRPYSGDRILVGKFAYQFKEPQRWDVAVFKYPGNAVTNYIKRLVGLPGETVVIRDGDIFIVPPGEPDRLEIARKPPSKLLAMLQLVFDNRYMPAIAAYGLPLRWGPAAPPGSPGRFEAVDPDGCLEFQTDGSAPGETWLGYEHRVPSFNDWRAIEREGRLRAGRQPPPQLIRDFAAYNTSRSRAAQPPRDDVLGAHWVGDLAMECTIDVQSETGEVILELVGGGERFQVRFDVATGEAALSIGSRPDWRPTASTRVRGPGKYSLRFANCDNKLYVWVGNRFIEFDMPTTYAALGNDDPTEADLQPAAVGSRGAALRVADLRLLRDIYYIAASSRDAMKTLGNPWNGPAADAPDMWVERSERRQEAFRLKEDQFFMLGDNSLRSKDGRLWAVPGPQGPDHHVDRDALIGKAIFIYWPDSRHRIPGTPIPFPYFPNFPRMGFVR